MTIPSRAAACYAVYLRPRTSVAQYRPAHSRGPQALTEQVLNALGWRQFFVSQVDDGEAAFEPVRVMAVHRDRIDVLGQDVEIGIRQSGATAGLDTTVGDWLLIDPGVPKVMRRLERFGVFRRRAAGSSTNVQLIAANVDTLFIVTSADRDFNVARLERYLALAFEAGAYPVIVITKADTAESTDEMVAEASRLAPGLLVEALDARDAVAANVLMSWCRSGQTVALVGSSGVGKSTLINTLTGGSQDVGAVRADDQRGRHTTTGRSMHRLPQGGWLIDTPGMRELQLIDVADALDDVFSDIVQYSQRCRFSDCSHEDEPGCGVKSAIEAGELDADRLKRFRKLQSEDRRNSESLAERHARDKSLGKLYKSTQSGKRRLQRNEK